MTSTGWRRACVAAAAALTACAPRPLAPPPAPPPPTPRAALVQAIDAAIDAPAVSGAQWGVLVVHPASGDTLFARNAHRLFVPASTLKLVTGAVAFATLGADFRATTTVRAGGPVRDGTIDGDLVLVGGGDPAWSDAVQGDAMLPLRELADSVAARGIRRVRGHVVAATAALGDGALGDGWEWSDLGEAYAAPVGALQLNEGIARLAVTGGARDGAPVQVAVSPHPLAVPVRVEAATATTPRPDDPVRASWDEATHAYVVRGTVAPGARATLRVAIREPGRTVATAWREELARRGVAIVGEARTDSSSTRLTGVPIATYVSPTLADLLRYFEKPSQNQIGETLLRLVGREVARAAGAATADSGLAVMRRQLAAWGADSTQAVLRDGSGLARRNLVSPAALAAVLAAMHRHPDREAFVRALPVAGTDGTLARRMRGTMAEGRVFAKTGYLEGVSTLAGFVRTRNDEWVIAVLLVNGIAGSTRDVERAQDAIFTRLAEYRWTPPGGLPPVEP